jgi:hypothetical protein
MATDTLFLNNYTLHILEVLKSVGHTFVMDFRKILKGMQILPVVILEM